MARSDESSSEGDFLSSRPRPRGPGAGRVGGAPTGLVAKAGPRAKQEAPASPVSKVSDSFSDDEADASPVPFDGGDFDEDAGPGLVDLGELEPRLCSQSKQRAAETLRSLGESQLLGAQSKVAAKAEESTLQDLQAGDCRTEKDKNYKRHTSGDHRTDHHEEPQQGGALRPPDTTDADHGYADPDPEIDPKHATLVVTVSKGTAERLSRELYPGPATAKGHLNILHCPVEDLMADMITPNDRVENVVPVEEEEEPYYKKLSLGRARRETAGGLSCAEEECPRNVLGSCDRERFWAALDAKERLSGKIWGGVASLHQWHKDHWENT